jgi:hypothetical protein
MDDLAEGERSCLFPVFLRSILLPFSSSNISLHLHDRKLKTPARSHGFCIGHVVPEAQVGGPIALVRDGDIIAVDAVKNVIELRVPPRELESRRKTWIAPPLKGTLYKYTKVVKDASHGCVTDA